MRRTFDGPGVAVISRTRLELRDEGERSRGGRDGRPFRGRLLHGIDAAAHTSERAAARERRIDHVAEVDAAALIADAGEAGFDLGEAELLAFENAGEGFHEAEFVPGSRGATNASVGANPEVGDGFVEIAEACEEACAFGEDGSGEAIASLELSAEV